MSFNEKLQKLRKENKMSQEHLADLLEVTRQSVSKWESGQTYPEMDKLLSICKIFKCTLEELTNDDITEIKSDKKSKNNLNTIIDSMLELVTKTYQMFKSMNFISIIKCLFTMFIIGLILIILYIPFELFIDGISNFIFILGENVITLLIAGFIELIVNISYFVLYIIIFVYLFKMIYLDNITIQYKWDNKEKCEIINHEDNKVIKKINIDQTYPFFHKLGTLVLIFIKIVIIFISIPIIISLFLLSILFIITLILIFKGVFYIGVLLSTIFIIIFHVVVIELIFNFIFNRNNNFKRIIIMFIVSIIGFGISFGIGLIEFINTSYINDVPESEKKDIISNTISLNDSMILFPYNKYDIKIDNNMGSNIKYEIIYCSEYTDLEMDKLNNSVSVIAENKNIDFSKIFNLVINNLKNKKMYNYSKLYDYKINVITSEETYKKLLENKKKFDEEEYNASYREEQKSYEENISNLQNELNKVSEEKNNLENEKIELENKLNNLQEKINEYKKNVNQLFE